MKTFSTKQMLMVAKLSGMVSMKYETLKASETNYNIQNF